MELTKKYYRIREVSDMVGVPLSTLRYWESEFKQLTPERNDKGTRYYTPAHVELVRQIKYLLHDRGLKIDAAKNTLESASNSVVTRERAINRLREIRTTLIALRDSLHRLR